ncbi:MAG: PD-(D/E)XK nuclease domain-containing protein [Desulfovibrionaceae bacterium]|nr:PD-(D/E)XK nuclease domain-containing protein [Desulfovibrionaceae bacterium]
MHNYWDKLVSFLRGFFLSTFKTNQYLERGLICGITRVDSDLGNFKVVSCTSNLYADCFGFTEQEVFDVMDEDALTNRQEVKKSYGIVIEFKTTQKKDSLDKTSDRALKQIYEKDYIARIKTSNVLSENIYVYGFAFKGQQVQIKGEAYTKLDW